jgi:hypothetical protein
MKVDQVVKIHWESASFVNSPTRWAESLRSAITLSMAALFCASSAQSPRAQTRGNERIGFTTQKCRIARVPFKKSRDPPAGR